MYVVSKEIIDSNFQDEIEDGDFEPLTLEEMFDQLFAETEHGDEEHRQWLKDKFTDFRLKLEKEND